MIHVCYILTGEKMLSVKLSQYHIYKLEATVGGCYFYSQRFDFGIWPPSWLESCNSVVFSDMN